MKSIDKALMWYFSKAALPYWSILLFDCLIILFSDYLVFAVNSDIGDTYNHFFHLLGTFSFYLIFYLVGFRMFHTYAGVIRFSSFIDLQRVSLAMGVGLALSLAFQWFVTPVSWLVYQRPLYMVQEALVAMMLVWSLRIWVKSVYDGIKRGGKVQKVFIYGAKEGGVALAKSINNQKGSPYAVAGFITGENDMVGKRLFGKRVFAMSSKIPDEMNKCNAKCVLVSPLKSDDFRRDREFVDMLIEAGIKIMMMSSAQEWDGKSDLNFSQFKDFDVEDLLPRDKIEVDMDGIGDLIRGRRILITGAAGSIGCEMVRQIAPYSPAELILVDQAETPLHDVRLCMAREWPLIHAHTIVADIANERRMDDVFRLHRPEYVFHAAAYKHVPMMEDNPAESIVNNVKGTCVVADLSVKYGARKFVMVSTDKAVNPTNVMGCSKRICEIYVQALDKAVKEGKVEGKTRFVTTRFGNVLGSNGSVIPLFKRQIKAGGPLTVTHPDIIRFFMLISEACKLVLEAGTMGHGGEIYVFDMGEPVRIADLAERMIRLSGAKNVEIKYIGLRDGEKLYEEVLNDNETTLPTFHPKIKIAKVREYDYDDIRKRIDALVDTATTSDDMTIVAEMKALVPEFKSHHSKYESLDK